MSERRARYPTHFFSAVVGLVKKIGLEIKAKKAKFWVFCLFKSITKILNIKQMLIHSLCLYLLGGKASEFRI